MYIRLSVNAKRWYTSRKNTQRDTILFNIAMLFI